MVLAFDEVIARNVAILDAGMLIADERVQCSHEGELGSKRPFLCIKVANGICTWVHVTKQHKMQRLCIDPWKKPGSPEWMGTPQYINDARKLFWGPSEAFVDASISELPHKPHSRPTIEPVGVDRVIQEVKKYNPAWN